MDGKILNLYPQVQQPADRNRENIPAANAGNNSPNHPDFSSKQALTASVDNQLSQDVHKIKDSVTYISTEGDSFVKKIKQYDDASKKPDDVIDKKAIVLAALSPIVPLRRISSLPDNISDDNYTRAAGLLGLALINLPEDFRDLGSAWNQVVHGKLPTYDFKNAQASFSFFRGTMLEDVINKMGKVGAFLHDWDIPLYDTKFGSFLQRIFKFNIDIKHSKITGRQVSKVMLDKDGKPYIDKIAIKACKIEGKPIAKLVGRALLRITLISFGILGLLELPGIVKKVIGAHSVKNKAKEGSKQTLKAIVNIVSIQAGISLMGAFLAKKGPAFSLLGMGIGSVIGTLTSKSIQKGIDKLTDNK